MTDRYHNLEQLVLLKSLKLVQNQIREYHYNPTTEEYFVGSMNAMEIHKG